jgi:hypothetical protein
MQNFKDKLDWSEAIHSPHFDSEILNSIYLSENLDWNYVFTYIQLDETDLIKYVLFSKYPWFKIAEGGRQKLNDKIINTYHDELFSTATAIREVISRYQIKDDVLEIYKDRLPWALVVQYQKGLSLKFIQNHYQHLLVDRKVTVSKPTLDLEAQTFVPVFGVFNRYSRERRCFIRKVKLNEPIIPGKNEEIFLPEMNELKFGRLVYKIDFNVTNRAKLGLKYVKAIKRYVMTNPWKHYPELLQNLSSSYIKPSLRFVLKKNGFHLKQSRTVEFNKFLIDNNLD